MDDDLLCPVCWETLLPMPTTNVCGHTFCRKCIIMTLDAAKPCPLCREPLVTNWGMPTTFVLGNALRVINLDRKKLASALKQVRKLERASKSKAQMIASYRKVNKMRTRSGN